MTDDTWKAIADDAIALLEEWDRNFCEENPWPGMKSYVMNADLVDLYRRTRAIKSTTKE